MANNSNNNSSLLQDDMLVNLVQPHLVSDMTSNHDDDNSVIATSSASTHDNNDNNSPPNEGEIPIPYHLPGAAITHDIYAHVNSLVMQALPRSKSLVNLKTSSTASSSSHYTDDSVDPFENLDKPGGFRRFHVHHKQLLQPSDTTTSFHRPNSISSSVDNYQTIGTTSSSAVVATPSTNATRHFLDYLAITSVINQFAGEDLSDSEQDDDTSSTNDLEVAVAPDESTTLISRHKKKLEATIATTEESKKANVQKTVFLLFKAFIGSGILFLPKAFSNGGLLFSVVTMWFMGAISLYCFLLLLDCKKYLVGSYGDMGGHLYGPWMRNIVLFSIAISQMGFMCGGTIFIVQNVTEAVRSLSHDTIHLNSTGLFILLVILLTPLVLIRNIAKLSPTALLSDVLIVAGLIVLLAYDFIQLFEDGITSSPKTGPNIHWLFNSANCSIFIGTAVYSFEGIGLIIPIRDSMEKPEKFPAVLTFVMILVASTLCAVGVLGYLAFGENIQTVALLNLPPGILTNSVQLGYAISILLSNALTLFPTIRIIEQALFGERTGKHSLYIKWEKNTLRAAIVMAGTLIAWAGANDLDKFISLIGSLCCCPLSLIFPPLFHMALSTTKGWKRTADIVLIIFGGMVMTFTFYNTTAQWVTSG